MSNHLETLLSKGLLSIPFDDVAPLPTDEGSFSRVFRARCRSRNIPVLLKFVLPELETSDPHRARSFVREASILGRLRGKRNIVELVTDLSTVEYEIKDPNLPAGLKLSYQYFGLALYPETLLRWLIDRRGLFSEAMALFRGVLDGLNQIHQQSVCHRDLKPSNCLLDGETVRVGDFGCARSPDSGDSIGSGEQYKWEIWGDLRYVAPDIFLGFDSFRTLMAADFYSLGCILFEISTGQILADVIEAALTKLERANKLLTPPTSARNRRLADLVVRDLKLGGYLPEVGVQLPIPGRPTRNLVQRLFTKLCTFHPAERLTDFPEVYRSVDQIIATARQDERRTKRS